MKALLHQSALRLVFTVLSAVCWELACQDSMAQNTIDFSRGHSLKVIYDAGLRPWRVDPSGGGALTITDQKVRIIAPGSTSFTLDVEIGSFGVLAENELASAEFISTPMSVQDAAAKAREIAQVLGVPTTGLDEKASQFVTLGDRTPVPQRWNGRSAKEGVRFDMTLDSLFGFNETRGRVLIVFRFYKPGRSMKFLTAPIKPPPGYEDVSMAPPVINHDKPFPDPAYSRENVMKRLAAAKAAGLLTPEPTVPPGTAVPTPASPQPTTATAPVASAQHGAWKWNLILGVLILATIGVITLKRRF